MSYKVSKQIHMWEYWQCNYANSIQLWHQIYAYNNDIHIHFFTSCKYLYFFTTNWINILCVKTANTQISLNSMCQVGSTTRDSKKFISLVFAGSGKMKATSKCCRAARQRQTKWALSKAEIIQLYNIYIYKRLYAGICMDLCTISMNAYIYIFVIAVPAYISGGISI